MVQTSHDIGDSDGPQTLAPDRELDGWIRLEGGQQVPDLWPSWSDEERLAWLRKALAHARRGGGAELDRIYAGQRLLRKQIHARIAYQARAQTVAGQARSRFLAAQEGKCASCGDELDGSGHLDHDHTCCPGPAVTACGECFRGLLCARCNTGLGLFLEDPERLRAAAVYIETWLARA